MLEIRQAVETEYGEVRSFYYTLIDALKGAAHRPGWKKGVYPADGNLPAERLYTGMGFQYVDTVSMFYQDTGWTDFLLYEYPLEEKQEKNS